MKRTQRRPIRRTRPHVFVCRAATVLGVATPLLALAISGTARTSAQDIAAADPNFQALVDALADRADLYERNTKRFTCTEVVIEARYDLQSGGNRSSKRTSYQYLFEEKRDGSLVEYRQEVVLKNGGESKLKNTDFEPPIPPAYTWASLFARSNHGRFLFRPAGQVVRAYRLLDLIEFIGQSPNPGGTSITGWAGTVAIDAKTLNLWSIEAEPSGQDIRLEVEILKYNKAFAIAGVPLASRPHGWKLDVIFGFERYGLSWPTEQVLSQTSLSKTHDRMVVEEKSTFRYQDYRFFDVVGTPGEVTGTNDDPDAEEP